MIHERILTYINLALILICGGCVYYLATADYTEPAEIQRANELLEKLKTETELGPPQVETPFSPTKIARHDTLLRKQSFDPFYTPTPTPTPTPPPPPPPPILGELVHSWKIVSLNADSADFIDDRKDPPEAFRLTVGGPPHMAPDKNGELRPIVLEKVDLDEFKAVVRFDKQTHGIPL